MATKQKFRFLLIESFASIGELEGKLREEEENLLARIVGVYSAKKLKEDGSGNSEVLNGYEYVQALDEIGLFKEITCRDDAPSPDSGDWENYITPLSFDYELIEWTELFIAGAPKWCVVLRERNEPILRQAGGTLKASRDGWDWLTPRIEGEDLVVRGAKCTWFGGPNDNQDTGKTSSGLVNTREQPEFRGCALPMNGFRRSERTMGSPIPRFKWMTEVEVEVVSQDLQGRKIAVPLVDLGPAKFTEKAIDLTEPAFNALGAASRRGVIEVDFRIRNWKDQLYPGVSYEVIPDSSSSEKPLEPNGDKQRFDPDLPSNWDQAAFLEFINSLQLRHFSGKELLPYFARVRNRVSNEPPHPDLWCNFALCLWVLDEVRERLGVPVHITSSYRHPNYNRQLNGASSLSQHMAFRAADFQASGVSSYRVYQEVMALRGTKFTIPEGASFRASKMTNSGHGISSKTPFNPGGLDITSPAANRRGSFYFVGGVGLYNSFVHIDCRGYNADW